MIVSHIVIRDSFTCEPRAVAVSFSDTARRANLAALLREYRANGFTVRTIETGAMYSATTARGYTVSIWYSLPDKHKLVSFTTPDTLNAQTKKGETCIP